MLPLRVRLDTTFGAEGEVNGHLTAWTAVGVAADAEGGILVSGPSNDVTAPPAEIVRRFTATGSLDTSFGSAGHVAIAASPDQWAQSLRILPDGRIGVIGADSVWSGDGGEEAFAARLGPNGSPDAAFGGGPALGIASGRFSAGLWQDDGGVFAFGDGAVLHVDPGGRVDASYPAAAAGAVDDKGDLVTGSGVRVSRYLPGGAPDTQFGGHGTVDLSWGDPGAGAPAIQTLSVTAGGGVCVIGSHTSGGSQYLDVARLTSAGSADATFAPVSIHGGPVAAGRLTDGRLLVWTAGGDLIAVALDGSSDVASLDVLGTVLAATLDAAERLVVVGTLTADPINANSRWFLRRYVLF